MKLYSFILFISMPFICSASKIVGVYDLDVNISGRAYRDLLVINEVQNDSELIGRFEVPKVFNVPIKGRVSSDKFALYFMAKEGNKEFRVDLEAKFISVCRVEGSLYQDKAAFATFLGLRRGCHE